MTLLTGNGSMDFEGLADLQWIGITIRWIVNGWMCWQIGMGLGDNDRIDMQLADWYGIGNMLPLGGTGIWIGDRFRSALDWNRLTSDW